MTVEDAVFRGGGNDARDLAREGLFAWHAYLDKAVGVAVPAVLFARFKEDGQGLACRDDLKKDLVADLILFRDQTGGAGALIAASVKAAEVIAFEDLGCESIKRLEFDRFPLICAIDALGGNLFK